MTGKTRTLERPQRETPKVKQRRGLALVLASLASTMAWAPPAAAAAPAPTLTSRDRDPEATLHVDIPLTLAITLAGSATWVGFELLTPWLAPSSCRWCDRHDDGTEALNGFDESVRSGLAWSDTQTADTLSTVFSYVLAPAAGFGVGALVTWHDDRLAELPADTLVVAEAAVIAMNLSQLSKLIFARERPDVHARSPAERAAQRDHGDNVSFFSGHTTTAFALATSAGTVASMRGHRLAPLMWAAGLTLASAGGYLRIAADRHYATDVLTAALVGSAVGVAVPLFVHRPIVGNARIAALPAHRGGVLSLSGAW